MKIITPIPASSRIEDDNKTKRRVVCYSRVSTDLETQASSLDNQREYIPEWIKEHPDWIFAGEYYDEGITGTQTKRRDGFNKMIADAMEGKFDLIVTKSISRMARNTVDTLNTIRMLKEKNVEIYFQKENIWTLDAKGELLITIMSSLAQEESRSISENIRWGIRKRFSDGKYSVAYSRFLGYDKGPDGKMVVNPEEAKIVKRIYSLYLSGHTMSSICRILEEKGIAPPAGGKGWSTACVRSILTNVKYKGDALLQKEFVIDYLTGRMKINEGELPMYYIENGHEAIIPPRIFDAVQIEVKRRGQNAKGRDRVSVFSAKIVCGDCGAYYGSKTTNDNTKYAKRVWYCNCKYKGERKCTTPTVPEVTLKNLMTNALYDALNQYLPEVEECLADVAPTHQKSNIGKAFSSFPEQVFNSLVEYCVIKNDSSLEIHFKL